MNDIERIRRVSLLQHDSTDCGAACLASVIRFFGGNTSVERIRKASGTTSSGTTMLGLYQAALQSGLNATGYEAGIDDIAVYENVLILHVQKEKGYDHYVVCFGFSSNRFTIWDPAEGIKFYTGSELERIWKSKKCLGLIPGERFRYEKDEKKKKKKWLVMSLLPDRDILLVSIFIGVIVAVLGLAMAVFTRRLIDEIIPAGDILYLVTVSALVLILLFAKTGFTAVRQSLLLSQGRDFNIRVVNRFYSTLLFLPRSFFDTRKTGDFVARLNDTMRIQKIVSDVAGTYIIDVLILVFTLTMIFIYSVAAGLISAVSLPVLFFIVHSKNTGIISLQYEAMSGYAINESNFINSLRGITEIKSLNWQSSFAERNNSIFADFQERAVRLGKLKIRLGYLTSLAGTVYLITVLVYSSIGVINSVLTMGELMAIVSLCSSLLPSVLNLALLPVPFNEAGVAISRMFEFTEMDTEEHNPAKGDEVIKIESLQCRNLSFRYPGQRLLLKDVSIKIERGKITALVGESGCGKSTIANILMRFYPPESGDINAVGQNISGNITVNRWRETIGLVPQEIHIFNSTILENIVSSPSEEKLKDLAVKVSGYGLEKFFSRMPAGLATIVGEDGLKLSGGQKQMLAFMRVLAQDPDIIIVDEGTSGMDRESEMAVARLLQKLKADKGILLITHKINLVKDLCDFIYVLEEGVISCFGTHDDLMCSENIYQRSWKDFS